MNNDTKLKQNAEQNQVEQLCDGSCRFGLRCVCLTPAHFSKADRQHADRQVNTCSVIAFPFEAISNMSKTAAAMIAAETTRTNTASGVTVLNQKQGREGSY